MVSLGAPSYSPRKEEEEKEEEEASEGFLLFTRLSPLDLDIII